MSHKYTLSTGNPLRGFKEANDYVARMMLKQENPNLYPDSIHDNWDAVHAARDYLKKRFDLQGKLGNQYHNLAHGTTDAYAAALRGIKKFNEESWKENGYSDKPIILMPLPTYGYFYEIAEHEGYEIRPVARNSKGTPDYDNLLETVKQCRSEKRVIAAFYDSNPNNPTGAIRTKEETKRIADIFYELNKEYKSLSDPKTNFGDEAHAYLIDDLVYMGTEYNRDNDIGIFLENDPNGEFSFTLMGPSKIGLANIRAGIMFYPSDLMQEIRQDFIYRHYGTSKNTANAITAAYGDKLPASFKAKRTKHITSVAEEYRVRGLMMKSLFNGLNKTISDAKERKKIREEIKQCTPRGQKGYVDKLMKHGIEHARITTSPQAGFFHLIDFESLRGKSFKDHEDVHLKYFVMDKSQRLYNYFRQNHDIDLRPPQMLGLTENDLTFCATFAINKQDIVGFAMALDSALKNVITPEPK